VRDSGTGTDVSRPAGLTRQEVQVHLGAAVVGTLLTWALVGVLTVPLAWRSAALAAGITIVVRALLLLAALGRAEWRREGPPARAYLRVAARFGVAFVLAGLATG
jgi:hypothetical protein